MRHVLAILILGATLALTAPAAFADQWINGFDVSTYSGCQAYHQSLHSGQER